MSRIRWRALATAVAAVGLLLPGVPAAPASAATHTVSGQITGIVTPGDPPIEVHFAGVWLFIPGTYDSPGFTDTDSHGRFSIPNVPAGEYTLRVSYPTWPNPQDIHGFGTQWYGDTPFVSEADHLSVNGDVVVNMTLDRGGSIGGTISGGGQGIADGFVWAYIVNPINGDRELMTGAETDYLGRYVLKNLAAGDYILEFFQTSSSPGYGDQYWQGAYSFDDATLVAVTVGDTKIDYDADLSPWTVTSHRLAGPDRFATAATVSAATFEPGVDVVFLTNGMNYPDALAAGPAAAKLGGPVLLTRPDELPTVVANELTRLAPDTVVIAGGITTVSEAVEQQVEDLGFDVVRLAGGDRFATSRLIADYAFDSSTEIFVATGLGFADALSAGAAAAYYGAPILLVNGADASIGAEAEELITGLGVNDVWVVGGANSVSIAIEDSLRVLASGFAQRLSGPDRYATSAEVLKNIFIESSSMYVAVGTNFPDALAGAAAAATTDSALVITPPGCFYSSARTQFTRLRVSELVLLGGTSTLSDDVLWNTCD